MVSLERKFDVLHHSLATFTRWLDTCSAQLSSLSSVQTDLESGHGGDEGTDEAKLRDLALQYKVGPIPILVHCWSHSHSCTFIVSFPFLYIDSLIPILVH